MLARCALRSGLQKLWHWMDCPVQSMPGAVMKTTCTIGSEHFREAPGPTSASFDTGVSTLHDPCPCGDGPCDAEGQISRALP